jgi:hypothetical protein
VNSDSYVSDILELFFQELTEEETSYGYFQQDSATAHTARNSMQRLRDVFDDKLSAKAYGRIAPPIYLFVTFICGVI